MKDIIVLGIETSCDETSAAVVKNGREVLSNVINEFFLSDTTNLDDLCKKILIQVQQQINYFWAKLLVNEVTNYINGRYAPKYYIKLYEAIMKKLDLIAKLSKDCDMIIGYIANDRMFVVLDRFFNGEITDLALINSLSALKLGKQYVALTEKACKKIKIIDAKSLSKDDLDKLKQESEKKRSKGIAMADEICRKYRRDGRFFDEILKAGEWNGKFYT